MKRQLGRAFCQTRASHVSMETWYRPGVTTLSLKGQRAHVWICKSGGLCGSSRHCGGVNVAGTTPWEEHAGTTWTPGQGERARTTWSFTLSPTAHRLPPLLATIHLFSISMSLVFFPVVAVLFIYPMLGLCCSPWDL